ncbi:MAG: hypothetical protein IPJ61_20180 [Tessaracoccus sp.]|uniref:hypothetical protein n=1 Tax=Tessaracoccus sp. TaxID=1971211 RepID=UPI001EC62117|nr:hypothetical protein [Tessaracoccus sp.]MBK7823306.1 hypothetical protein [Tessaracoccus sp.]
MVDVEPSERTLIGIPVVDERRNLRFVYARPEGIDSPEGEMVLGEAWENATGDTLIQLRGMAVFRALRVPPAP